MNAPTFLLSSTEYARRCVCVCAIRGKREKPFANKTGGIVLFACGYAADRIGSAAYRGTTSESALRGDPEVGGLRTAGAADRRLRE